MKACSKCGEAKPLEQFHKQPTGALGRRADCKACVSKQKKLRNAMPEVKQHRSAYSSNYYRQNAEVFKERARRYHKETPHVWWEFHYRKRCAAYGHEPKLKPFTRDELIARCGDVCVDCGNAWEELDHVTPVWFGGEHSLDNCQPVCSRCNADRWTREKELRGFGRGPIWRMSA